MPLPSVFFPTAANRSMRCLFCPSYRWVSHVNILLPLSVAMDTEAERTRSTLTAELRAEHALEAWLHPGSCRAQPHSAWPVGNSSRRGLRRWRNGRAQLLQALHAWLRAPPPYSVPCPFRALSVETPSSPCLASLLAFSLALTMLLLGAAASAIDSRRARSVIAVPSPWHFLAPR